MTRTDVRRQFHIDVADGRPIIRKIVVATSECRDIAPTDMAPGEDALANAEVRRPTRLRPLRPGTYAARIRRFHLI